MANRVVFQVDQAESEDQELYGDFEKCCSDSDMDCAVCLPVVGLHQVSVQVRNEPAENPTLVATQSFREKGFRGAFARCSSSCNKTGQP